MSFPSWYISTYSLSSSIFSCKLFCYYSIIHCSSLWLLYPSHFTPTALPQFLEAAPWLYSIFNFLSFSLFTTYSFSFAQNMPSSSIPFYQSLLQKYIKYHGPLNLQVDTSIINYHPSIPEPQLVSYNTFFDDLFGMPFQDTSHITHIRNYILWFLSTIPSCSHQLLDSWYYIYFHSVFLKNCYLLSLLRTWLLLLLLHIINVSVIVTICNQCQVLDAYVVNEEIVILMPHLIYHQPFDKITLLSLPSQYRNIVANNTFGIIENCLVFYETVPTTINKNILIVFLFLLGIQYFLFRKYFPGFRSYRKVQHSISY